MARVMYISTLALFLIRFLPLTETLWKRNWWEFYGIAAAQVCILPVFWLAKRGSITAGSYLLLISALVSSTSLLSSKQDTYQDLALLIYPTFLVLAGLLLRRRAFVFFSLLLIACVTVVTEFHPPELPKIQLVIPFLATTAVVVGILADSVRTSLARARESEERFRTMADGAPIPIWVTDAQGVIQFANRTYRAFAGETGEPIRAEKLIHPEDLLVYSEAFRRASDQHTSFSAEARMLRSDGEWRWVASYGEPRESPHGQYLGHGCISRDITDAKRAEERERRRAKILEAIAGGDAFEGTLELIAKTLESEIPEARCSILYLDEEQKRFCRGAGVNLPYPLQEACSRELDSSSSACGTAALAGERLLIRDTQEPQWADYAALLRQANLRACWSEPILRSGGSSDRQGGCFGQ